MKYRIQIFLGVFLLIAISVLGFFFMRGNGSGEIRISAGRTVVFTDKGFSPVQMVVRIGDTVTFTNNSDHEFWPASSPHPTHDTYSAFDPRKPIDSGKSWDFTFTQAGTWKYHDHLASDQEGTVIVLDADGKVVDTTCTGNNATSVGCYQEQIVSVLEKQGLEKALDKMSDLYDTQAEFRDTCHAVSHTLGKAAYHVFAQGKEVHLTGKTSYCSYGFYHGFMEEMLQVSGDFEEARRFCSNAGKILSSESANAEGACYHGIGHGTVDGSDPRTWGNPMAIISPGLLMCDKVDSTEPHFYRCASGAFNALSLMYIWGQYDLKLADGNPFKLCLNWSEYRIQNPCYQEMNTLVMKVTEGSLPKGIKLVETIEDPMFAKLAMTSMSGVAPSHFKEPFAEDFKRTIDECHAARKDLVVSCIRGIPSGIMEFGTPGKEYVAALDFCSSKQLTETERTECMRMTFGGVRSYYSSEKQAAICASVDEKYREACAKP